MKKIATIFFNIVMGICIAQPVNDNCPGGALLLHTTCISTSGTIAGGTFSGSAASCGGLPNHDVFYNFVALGTSATITVNGCSGMDAVIQIYSGSCGGTSIACFNSTGIGASETGTLTSLTAGNTYWVRVYDFFGIASCGTFNVCVTVPPPPALNLIILPTAGTCYGNCTSSAIALISGGYGPYGYSWTGPLSFTANTDSIYSLCTGTYNLTITDSFNLATITSSVIITQLAPSFSISVSNDSTFCPNDTISLNVGVPPEVFPASCGLSMYSGCIGVLAVDTIGTDTTTNAYFNYPAPFANWYTSNLQQYLYRAAELNAAGFTGGRINAIDWFVTDISPIGITSFHNFTVKMKCTTSNSLSSSLVSGLTTVFPSQTVNITLGWNSIVFPSGYYWDGTSNLIVQVCNSEGPPWANYTFNARVSNTATTYISTAYWLDNIQNLCGGVSSTFAGFNSNKHPNMRVHYCTGVSALNNYSYLWTPATGNITNDTTANTSAFPDTTTNYVVTVTNNVTGCYLQDTVTMVALNCLTDISALKEYADQLINLYPNPTTGELRIRNYELGIKEIKITNLLGEEVRNWQLAKGNKQCMLDISALAKGLYFLEIKDEKNNVVNKKVVKQ